MFNYLVGPSCLKPQGFFLETIPDVRFLPATFMSFVFLNSTIHTVYPAEHVRLTLK
jgi:predicted SAM-dependent methyltransferase